MPVHRNNNRNPESHRVQGPCRDGPDVFEQVVPGDHALHVHMELMPQSHDLLVQLLCPEQTHTTQMWITVSAKRLALPFLSSRCVWTAFQCHDHHVWKGHGPSQDETGQSLSVINKRTISYGMSHLAAVSTASWFRGGTVKHTEGTMASFPVGLITFHLVLWELSSRTHSSPRFIVIWKPEVGCGEEERGWDGWKTNGGWWRAWRLCKDRCWDEGEQMWRRRWEIQEKINTGVSKVGDYS